MSVTISHAQRDAVYDQILDRLSGIEDIWLAASKERYETADRLGREYSDELRLVLDDLGWGDGPEVDAIELTTPSDVLRRVFGRLRDTAAGERAAQATSWTESRVLEARNRLVGEACQVVLATLVEDEEPAMRIGLVPRLLPGYPRATGTDDALSVPLGSGEEVNRAVLSGLIAAEPVRDTSRDGDPITVLLVSFSAPDERVRDTSTCCEVEVTDSIADRHRRRLRVGRRVWVAGQLTGNGLWATSLGTP